MSDRTDRADQSGKEEQDITSNRVLDKIPAIFVCQLEQGTQTEKTGRFGQKYLATPSLNSDLAAALKKGVAYKVTAKIDGTSVYVRGFKLLKRRDQKPHRKTGKMNVMPKSWFRTGEPGGQHCIGFMDLEKGDKWFFDVFERDPRTPNAATKEGHPLIDGIESTKVRCLELGGGALIYVYREISELNDKTFELIGPKLQGNPHGLEHHCLVEHGAFELHSFPEIGADSDCLGHVKDWMTQNGIGCSIEGIVLHLDDGAMYKIHRHHLDMEWSAEKPLTDLQF